MERVADRLRSVRSRHRRGRHEEAHSNPADELKRRGVKKQLGENRLVPTGKASLISDTEALSAVLEDLARPGDDGSPARFAFDTEFIGESTYDPKLCLIQVATPRQVALIDPLAEIDLTPFWQLMVDPAIEKIVHAGEQDLGPVARLTGKAPANVWDTQIAAGFCGLPFPASLGKLVEYVSTVAIDGIDPDGGLKLGKGYTFTQWDERPLSGKQLSYAADDVRYLPLILSWIESQLDDERHDWAVAECERRCRKALHDVNEAPWARLKGYSGLNGHGRPIVRELATWRDTTARAMDLPPRAVVKDEVLVGIARHPPKSIKSLAEIRHMPRPIAEEYGQMMLDAVARGLDADREDHENEPYEPTLRDKFDTDAAWAILQSIAYAKGLDPNLLASRRDVETVVRQMSRGEAMEDLPVLSGWRAAAAGQALLEQLRR